jgi:hypothetical protein
MGSDRMTTSVPGQSRRFAPQSMTSGLPLYTDVVTDRQHVSKVPKAYVALHSIRRRKSRQLTPFDSVYIDWLQEAFEMAGTNACDVQGIPDVILHGS